MKRLFWVISLLLVICIAPSFGQTVSSDNLTVSVPFDFIVNNTVYPAGDYIVRLDTFGNRISIGNHDQWISFVHTWNIGRSNANGKTRLVFTESSGKRYLHQVWIAGQDHGHDLIHDSMDFDIH